MKMSYSFPENMTWVKSCFHAFLSICSSDSVRPCFSLSLLYLLIATITLLLFNPCHLFPTVTPLLFSFFPSSSFFLFLFLSLWAPALARALLPTRQATWTIPGGRTWLWVPGTWAPRDPHLHTTYRLSGPFPSLPPLVPRNRPLLPASRRGPGAWRKGQLIKRNEAVSNE